MRIRSLQLSLVVALAAGLAAAPADAQGKGNKKEKSRTEEVRNREHRDDRRDEDRWDDRVRLERREGKRVPPGWCKGKGNPHNTPENCGYDRRDDRRDDDRYDDRRYDDRRSRSYEDAHRAFHREHDQVCRERASQRPFDARWQLRVRTECKLEHDRWHDRAGQPH
ncbi:MAG TPA: hypothetical protein VGR37_15190 [Longimicrobiaceae bacterium]|nr:hypothetical protein [Longimicrobiaceae bacterium]